VESPHEHSTDTCGVSGALALRQALLTRNEDFALLLLDNGVNPHLTNIKGQTALHLAVKICLEVVSHKLLEQGLDTNVRD
jgi:ankyrin repeat protein